MAAAGISRRYSAGTFRPSVVVTRHVALAVPIHPHRMIPVSWSGAGHSSGIANRALAATGDAAVGNTERGDQLQRPRPRAGLRAT
jgi:hypothetical protein